MKKSNKLTIYIVIAMIAGGILGYYIHENYNEQTIASFSKNSKLLTTIFLRLV
jgi:Na+/H+-dicarboxylate symporter